MTDRCTTFETTVDRLLAELTDDELVTLLHQDQPAIPRLGLAGFHTGQEAAHGVAWRGVATVFPQPVGLAASFDPELVTDIGAAVGVELRAMHVRDPEQNSLNAWAPVVNPLRNPLWGRNEEGWSEDPHLTGAMAAAYASGMRGQHPTHWRVVPTLKHLLAYNNETDRCTSSSSLSPRVLHEYDLPAFQLPLAARAVGAVMPAYNLVNGRPCHVHAELMDEVRRFDPEVVTVSDAWAPTNLSGAERAFDSRPASHAAAVRAGLDSFTDGDRNPAPVVDALRAALDAGLLGVDLVRTAARRLLLLRARTGEFSPDDDPWTGIGAEQVDTPAHRSLARRAAAGQVVVLENRGALPTNPSTPAADGGPHRLAVVGPQSEVVKHDWYSGTPPYSVTIAGAAREAGWLVTSDDGSDHVAFTSLDPRFPGHALTRDEDGALVLAEPLADPAVHRVIGWGADSVTITDHATGLLWSGQDNGMVMVDSTRPGGWVAREEFREHRHDDGSWSLQHVGSGRWLRHEHFGGLVSATAPTLAQADRWHRQVVSSGVDRAAQLASGHDEVWVVLGNDPHLQGRETQDRPGLSLPGSQVALWSATANSSAPRVLVLVSSYPYALGSLAEQADAVVWTSHAGQELGHGVVDVLTGAVGPRARLAQTWWADEVDAGGLFDYDVMGSGLTYQWSRATPEFAFGHGLGYSRTEFSDLDLKNQRVRVTQPGEPALGLPPDIEVTTATVTVTNVGERVVDELVQVYASALEHPLSAPLRVLVAHRWVRLHPGESVRVSLPVSSQRLATWSVRSGSWRVERSRWRLYVGRDCLTPVVSAELAIEADDPPPVTWPLLGWTADDHQSVEFVAAPGDRGTAVRALGPGVGGMSWREVTVNGPVRLHVGRGRGRARLFVSFDSRREIQLPAEPGWHTIDLPLPPGWGPLDVAVEGSAMLWKLESLG
ncbi:glycoside hydrolase family 3 N-terminal domain-containing protein [Aestuariimicrobium sp. T2.26MG-19.2B]|uniref:glycoside hydrolase family 3 N-terminal domain-containing protein n=1 Tax=Aestuariimicrobium sp. T2.26MG-19.2B TaxID=3040679 RepID=UPI0024775678|nr:glycoside hydrolase family 3 N-terminal domain-containing protein [Aestuariimicrobium sp. T2.26MG-19.2B]CAI9405584.1 hypothetical protein AESSP_01443 [Aestuariimicrobium sp. T2.26MG-19.2B]